jgi:hypothetical protein
MIKTDFKVNELSGIYRKIVNELVTFRLGNCYLKQLPKELLDIVLENLDEFSLFSLARTCKYLRKSVLQKQTISAKYWINPEWKPYKSQ